MNVLMMDTAREMLVVVLIAGDKTYIRTDDRKNGHSLTLLGTVDQILADANLTLAEMDYFCANVGPGSFTGIRIGVCTANAFGYVYKKPVLPLTTFMPYRTADETIVLDAKHGNVYYEKGNGQQGFSDRAALGEVVEITGVQGASQYRRAAQQMIDGRMETDQLTPLYLKASEAECKESK